MCRLFLVTAAILAIFFGTSGLYMLPKLIQQKIEQRIQLKIGTKTFDRFTRIPIPLTVKFYFFNVTNSDQVLAGNERPKFQEVGPFMFKQWRRREIDDIIDNNRKITYKEVKTFYPMYPTRLLNTTKFLYFNTETNKYYFNAYDTLDIDQVGNQNQPGDSVNIMTTNEQQQQQQQQLQQDNQTVLEQHNLIKMLNPQAHNLTLVNLPLLSVLTQLANLEDGTIKRSLASKIVSKLIVNGHEKILITRAANQFLFDGYQVGLMDAASDLLSNTLGYNFDSPLPRNRFGFFHNKNGTWSLREAGKMTIFTGRNNSMDSFMLVDNWNGMKTLKVWPQTAEAGNRCNEIRGTDGSQFHPGVTRQQILSIFSPMICTSIFVKYKEDTSVKDIPLLRFTTPPDVFAAPKKNPLNSCYCTIRQQHTSSGQQSSSGLSQHGELSASNAESSTRTPRSSGGGSGGGGGKAKLTNARCYIDGLMDLSLCQRGAPVAASGAHFYNSDPMLALAAGLEPRKDKHETYLDIEPMTGAVMRAASRAQLNAFVERAALDVVEPDLIGHMTPMVAPLIWFEESAQIDEKSSREFKGQLLNLVQKAHRGFLVANGLGVLILIGVGLAYWYSMCYKIGSLSSKRQTNNTQVVHTSRRHMSSLNKSSNSSGKQRRRERLRRQEEMKQRGRNLIGARKANLSGCQPLIRLDTDEDGCKTATSTEIADTDKQLLVAGGGGGGAGGALSVAKAVGVAVALGAADAAATANQRRARTSEQRRRLSRARAADYEQEINLTNANDTDEDDEYDMARPRGKWPPPAPAKSGQTPGETSTSPSILGGNDEPVSTIVGTSSSAAASSDDHRGGGGDGGGFSAGRDDDDSN